MVTSPAKNSKWDLSSLTLEQSPAGKRVDLTVVKVEAGGGLYTWTLVAPGPRSELKLPDLSALAPDAALPVGSMTIQASLAHIEGFDYGSLRYRELGPRGWNAYATDTFLTQH